MSIRVTVWNEFFQENGEKHAEEIAGEAGQEVVDFLTDNARKIREVHDGGAIHWTIKNLVEEDPDIVVMHIGTTEMEECGLTEEVLNDTDVLIWWAHIAHHLVSDQVAERVRDHVNRGMGVIFLHSAHLCKPMMRLLGTSCTLRWQEGQSEHLWNMNPTHPIAQGVPVCTWLEEEEMYGEYFDIPKPDDIIFIGGFSGGEVFRSGCTWTRGYGRIFYFQPGHETNRSYFQPDIRRIIKNAVHWCYGTGFKAEKIECISV